MLRRLNKSHLMRPGPWQKNQNQTLHGPVVLTEEWRGGMRRIIHTTEDWQFKMLAVCTNPSSAHCQIITLQGMTELSDRSHPPLTKEDAILTDLPRRFRVQQSWKKKWKIFSFLMCLQWNISPLYKERKKQPSPSSVGFQNANVFLKGTYTSFLGKCFLNISLVPSAKETSPYSLNWGTDPKSAANDDYSFTFELSIFVFRSHLYKTLNHNYGLINRKVIQWRFISKCTVF